MVEAMDLAVGKVLDALDRLQLAGNTVVIFMSDNGGLSTSEGSPTSNIPLRAGKGWMYEGGIREPMIIRAPAITTPGSVNPAPVISTDFYPTILDLAGLSARPAQHLDGVSLKPLLRGGEIAPRPMFWHYPHYGNQGGSPSGAIRDGDWKLIEWYEDSRLELFNLRQDLSEKYNLVRLHPEKAEQLHTRLKAWRQKLGATMPSPNPRYKPE
jgi:arylsulfatase A-like enzyme